jgi:Flp pilus assembly pilin Flp
MKLRTTAQRLWNEEDGMGTLEVILIIAVILILAIAFRKWIVGWFENLLKDANTQLEDKGKTSVDSSVMPKSVTP